jgi:hypothetical protein
MKILSVVAAMFFLVAGGATAETTNDLSDAEIQGRNLVQQLLEQTPATNFTQNGILKIRHKEGDTTNVFVAVVTWLTPENWGTVYLARTATNNVPHTSLKIFHKNGQANRYVISEGVSIFSADEDHLIPVTTLAGNETMIPFAGSDFWICDLGLEFFHWPEQKILKHEMRRSRACTVLESTNPKPSANGYSRVVSWIDNETLGIVHAEAYDVNGKLLKEFDPKSFKKVNGQWELQEMEIRNVQTGSRSRIEFDLNKE